MKLTFIDFEAHRTSRRNRESILIMKPVTLIVLFKKRSQTAVKILVKCLLAVTKVTRCREKEAVKCVRGIMSENAFKMPPKKAVKRP